jgi:hypothetical protein
MTATPRSDCMEVHVHAIRRFNRFYTQRIGVLQPKLLDSASR